jgi:uncharacterized membrane protein YuzA (DUF378 family)
VTPPPGPRGGGSTLRFLTASVLIIVAVATAVLGFVRLITVLDRGGYGTSAMRLALFALGIAGALLAAGVATMIWELSKRYENTRESEQRDTGN